MNSNDRKDNQGESNIDLVALFSSIKRYYLEIILFTVMVVATAGLVSFYFLPPVYEAKTMIMIKQVPGNNGNTAAAINTYVGQVKSDLLMQRVINQLGLEDKQDIAVKRPFPLQFRSEQPLTPGSLSGQVNARAVKDSNLIEITVKDNNPRMAALIANTLSQEFQLLMTEKNKEMVEQTVKTLRSQIVSLQLQMAGTIEPAERQLLADTLVMLNDRAQVAYSIDMGNTGMVIASPAMEPLNPVSPNKVLNITI